MDWNSLAPHLLLMRVPLSVGSENYATTDILLIARPIGPGVEMGAYEAPLMDHIADTIA